MRKMHFPVGRRPADLLGLKVKSDLDEELETSSKEKMEEMHKSTSYRKGSASAGFCINASLACLSPTNLVGTAICAHQFAVARCEQKKIEKAAKKLHGADFRKDEDRVNRRRHEAAGAAAKTCMSAVLLGQADLVTGFSLLGGLDLNCPVTEVEHRIKTISDAFYGNPVISNLQDVAGLPAHLAQNAFGIDHNPTWDDLVQAPSPALAAPAVAVIGVAVEANVVMLTADQVGEAAHRQIIRDLEIIKEEEDSYYSCDEDEDSEAQTGCSRPFRQHPQVRGTYRTEGHFNRSRQLNRPTHPWCLIISSRRILPSIAPDDIVVASDISSIGLSNFGNIRNHLIVHDLVNKFSRS